MRDDMIEDVAVALEPKLRGFGSGDMPMQIARELARTAIEAMDQWRFKAAGISRDLNA
jgi:hypothetical protein